jgi:phage shock protein C
MYRSFYDRVLAGVCGGMAARLPVNTWVIRLTFIGLALLTLGAFAVLYVMLWLAIPQASPTDEGRRGGLWFVVAMLLIVLVLAGWYANLQGLTHTPDGANLFYPALLFALSLIYFLRQIGRPA